MKRTNVYLDEEQARLLRHLAVEEGRSFTALVREALNDYLARRGLAANSHVVGPQQQLSDDEWRSSFKAAVERIRASVPDDWTPEEIEAEITAAREEVCREGTTRRPATSA
ncbi:MAG: CopG family transcriptional regulator [Chloroflexi bacterium]|nr:CopG family transcriptional regulator [Chloroflexota bacterium]